MAKKTTVTLPRAKKGEADTLFVCMNGVNYLIPKGVSVEVPDCVAEEIQRAQEADDYYHREAERMQNLPVG